MLEINSPLFKLITILFRQLNLSIGRYSEDEDFYEYFKDKHKYYKYAIKELDDILYNPKPLTSFSQMVKKCFFTRTMGSLNVLLVYKILKEFDEILFSGDIKLVLCEKKINYSSGSIYWGLLRCKLKRKERKLVEEIEHFGQNFRFSHYRSIEETLLKLDLKIDINN